MTLDFIMVVTKFFQIGNLLRQWKHTLIILVLKSSHAAKVEDYKPISCYTIFYKVISKIIMNRMIEVSGQILQAT